MIIFRVISLVTISAALMLLGADALTSLEQNTLTMRSTSDVLGLVGQDAAAVQSLLSSGALEAAAPVVSQAMAGPAWVPIGILGLILALIFRVRD